MFRWLLVRHGLGHGSQAGHELQVRRGGGGGGREIGTGHRSWVAVGGCGFWMMGHRS